MERVLVKGMYVVGCCTTAAWLTSLCFANIHGTPSDSGWDVGIVSSVLLFALLIVAFWLGTRGKPSASWLTLSYGSWMTIYTMMYYGLIQAKHFGVWPAAFFVALALLTWGGLRAAVRNQWLGVLKWWLWSFAFVAILYYWGQS